METSVIAINENDRRNEQKGRRKKLIGMQQIIKHSNNFEMISAFLIENHQTEN